MTCSIETYCQKPMFGALRYQLNLPSKRPKDRPTTLPVRLLINGEWRTQQVPIADYPLVLFAPILPLPRILDGPDRPQGGGPLRHFHKDMSSGEKRLELLQRYGATHIASQSQSRIDKFGRMLAKIAHSYAVASYGLGNFRPLLINTIRGTEHDPTQLVGGSTYKPRPVNKLHVLKIGWNRHAGKDLLIVRLNLFANLGLPVYFCVAGER
jgi:hypothetical protein